MEALATFEVRIDGKRGNTDLKPTEFDIRELRGLLDEVEVLLFPNDRRERPVISYEVAGGSVRNLFRTGVQSIASLGAVIGLVNTQRTLDILEPRTAKAFETIQQWAIEKDYVFTLTTSTDPVVELRVDRSTAYFRTEATLVETELYLYGKVTDAGGKEKPNIHLQVEGQGIFTIDADESFLAALEHNILYHQLGIRAIGRQNVHTGEIERGSLKLIELIDYDQRFEENYLAKLQAKAKGWLKDIDPDQYLNDVGGK
ncbi:MAG: hypothetical protein WAR83_02785 [Flavobacteriales bacterium]